MRSSDQSGQASPLGLSLPWPLWTMEELAVSKQHDPQKIRFNTLLPPHWPVISVREAMFCPHVLSPKVSVANSTREHQITVSSCTTGAIRWVHQGVAGAHNLVMALELTLSGLTNCSPQHQTHTSLPIYLPINIHGFWLFGVGVLGMGPKIYMGIA